MLLERQIIGKRKREVIEVLKNRGYAYFEEENSGRLLEGYYTHASVCLSTIRVFFKSGKAVDFEVLKR